MIIKIKKRDGRTVTFNIEKIAGAIYKAAQSVGKDNYEEALELSGKVVDKLMEKHLDMPTVEEIQDCVERVLIEEGMADTAKSYILYRSNRTRAREMNTRLMKVYEDLTFQSAKDNDLKRENANIDGDTAMGTMLKYGSVGAKEFNEMYVLAPEHSKAHHREEASDSLQVLSLWRRAAVPHRKAVPGNFPSSSQVRPLAGPPLHPTDFCRSAWQVLRFPGQSDLAPDYKTETQNRYHLFYMR